MMTSKRAWRSVPNLDPMWVYEEVTPIAVRTLLTLWYVGGDKPWRVQVEGEGPKSNRDYNHLYNAKRYSVKRFEKGE